MRKAAWVASASAGWLKTIRFSHFRERSCSNSARETLLFLKFKLWKRYQEILLPLRIARTLAALQVLVTALCSKRPSAWTLFTSWCCTCCGEKFDVKGKKAELTERFVWSCLFLHTYNTPSAFLGCRMRDLLDSEAGGDALSSRSVTPCRRDSRR